jgi:protein-glucosylgalactosylhydroxylysine glucosidase
MLLGALGMVNGRAVQDSPIDDGLMNATLAYSIDGWDWEGTWGWDYPMWALTQMRLSWSSSSVVDMLLRNETKNTYFANGHNFQGDALACYLPGNGGLLAAVAMMAGGYMDGEGNTVEGGFPPEWGARSEGFKVYP